MASLENMDKGAHFFRTDLQVHTPRDLSWKGVDRLTSEERSAYAELLVRSCRNKGLQAIAITDHHDMGFVGYVRRAAEEETDEEGKPLQTGRLVVFPGIELTLGVPCQALLVFDANFPDDMFSLAMTALTIMPSAVDEAKTAPVQRLDGIVSLKQLKEKLDEYAYLRERYIILPNVSDGGSCSLLRKGQAGKYIEMPCVGGYVDGELAKLGDGNRRIIEGKAKEWGNKRIACFQTSDNRREDHKDLARSTTWIKWAAPTAEALRQACLAQESRVSQEEPKLPAVCIRSISVSNSAFLGPFDLELSRQYSALIGGRGTGKSTILEYLRWALCDQPPGLGGEDAPNYQQRRSRLIEQTLKPLNASVQVRFEINDVPHLIRRSSEDGALHIKIAGGEMRPCTEDEVRSLLPIQAYSQKQLSDVGVRIEELSRFITTPIRSELSQIERNLADKGERVRQTHAVRQRQRALQKLIGERELEAKSLEEQANALRKSLTGLSEDDQKLLEQGPGYEVANQAVEGWLAEISSLLEGAGQLRGSVELRRTQAEQPPKHPEGAILKAAYEEQQMLLADAQKTLEALIARADEIAALSADENADSPWSNWAKKIGEFRKAYSAAMQRSSVHMGKVEQLQAVDRRAAEHKREIAALREELKDLGKAGENYQAELAAWHELHDRRDELIDAQCQKLTRSSGEVIRAQIRRYADHSVFSERLREVLSGSNVRREKIERLGESIVEADKPQKQWESVLADLELLANYGDKRPETPTLTAIGFTPSDLQKICASLSADAWLSISLTPIKSMPVFEYQSREGEYIPFADASVGQQATALLKSLLNQPGPPLIIDQPEEDLDNPVILEIVEQVWWAKQKRQLVFSSHNANLVVNGDAELVVWCNYRTASDQSRGQIAGEGAIDIPEVCNAIKSIMEGGEAAFNLRREKYGF